MNEQYFLEEEQSQELLSRTGSNIIEDNGEEDYMVPSRNDGQGYHARSFDASDEDDRGRCPIPGCVVGCIFSALTGPWE